MITSKRVQNYDRLLRGADGQLTAVIVVRNGRTWDLIPIDCARKGTPVPAR
jgi:hypothetical protein